MATKEQTGKPSRGEHSLTKSLCSRSVDDRPDAVPHNSRRHHNHSVWPAWCAVFTVMTITRQKNMGNDCSVCMRSRFNMCCATCLVNSGSCPHMQRDQSCAASFRLVQSSLGKLPQNITTGQHIAAAGAVLEASSRTTAPTVVPDGRPGPTQREIYPQATKFNDRCPACMLIRPYNVPPPAPACTCVNSGCVCGTHILSSLLFGAKKTSLRNSLRSNCRLGAIAFLCALQYIGVCQLFVFRRCSRRAVPVIDVNEQRTR